MNGFRCTPKFIPDLDRGFRPIALENRAYREALSKEDKTDLVKVAIERTGGFTSTTELDVFTEAAGRNEDNIRYVERMVKSLIWIKGGYKVIYAGPEYIGAYLKKAYQPGSSRDFDAVFMADVYGEDFIVEVVAYDQVPESREEVKSLGRNLEGCRIGFDAGGSDRKVSAVIDGEAVYSEEVVWHPKITEDPQYHYDGILDSMKRAAEKMPRVDAIGVSAAGIYIDNQVKAASLFRVVPKDAFEKKVRNIFYDVAAQIGDVPIEVANDGDVTALAGAMSLGEACIFGIAMGTSEAAGYVDENGNITGWLNELAFVPVDYSEEAIVDEWSQDRGVGVSYFSQDAVIKLAPNAGVELDASLSPAEKLKVVQDLMKNGDDRARKIYDSIGVYLGYSIAYYAEFYKMNKVLLLGRVTSGQGGDIMINMANRVLEHEFPELFKSLTLMTPDEKSKRVGQSIAAASLPVLR